MGRFFLVIGLLLLIIGQGLFAADLGVVFFGDWGQGNKGQKKVAAAMAQHCQGQRCDFILALGDNFYPAGVKSATDPQWKTSWANIYGGLKLPFYACLGNHDYMGNAAAQIDFGRSNSDWIMPSEYYRFEKANIAFFAIDTERWDAKQANWLSEQLADSSAKWKIVFGHHPLFSGGMHGDTAVLKKELLPILKDTAHLYLSGHDHDLQVIQRAGAPLAVVSGAAAETRPVKKVKGTLYSASQLGFGYLNANDDALEIQLISTTGAVLYSTQLP